MSNEAIKGNPENVHGVIKGEVLISFEDDPKFDIKGVPVEESKWQTLGILNEGSAIELNRTVEKNKTLGWGYGTVAVSTKPGETTATCETLEDNEAVRAVAWPKKKKGTSVTIESGESNILYHTGDIARAFVAFIEERDNGTKVLKVSRHKAYLSMENLGFSQEVTGRQISIDFIAGKNGDMFDEIVLNSANEEVANNDDIIRFKNA